MSNVIENSSRSSREGNAEGMETDVVNKWFVIPVSNDVSNVVNKLMLKHDIYTIGDFFKFLVDKEAQHGV